MVLIKMINDFFLLRLGTTSLDYTGFVQLVIQTAIHVHRKGRISGISPKDAFKMMYSDMVLSHFKQYREQAWKRGEDWDFIANDAGQKTNGKQESGQIDSQEPVQSIKTQIFQNKIPDQVRMVLGEAKCAALEIINDRVMRLFDFSILPSVAVEKLSSKKHTRNRSSIRIESAKMIEQKKTDQRKVNRVNEQNSQQSSEKQKQEPDYPIYTAANLAKRISYFNPINEKRNVRRDKENEQLLMVLPMSPALKVACFELQQVQPQIRMEDYRDVSLCLELVLQSVAGFQTYPGSLSVKPPQQVRKRIVLDPVQQAGTPKIPVKLGIRELKKQQQELEELEKKKRNEEFLKRGLKLKEQLTSDQEMKELLAQRAKNVKNVRLLSVQKYHDRLQQAQPQQSRNGDNRRMQDSQSQNVLNRNNSNRDLDNVSHSKRLKNPASYSTLDVNRRDLPKNSSQANRNTYVSNVNSDRNGKKNNKNQQGPNTYGDRGLKNGGQDDSGFGSNGDHGRNYGNQNDDRQGSDRDRERNYGGQNYDRYGSNGDRGRNYGDKNEDREDPNGDRYRNDGSLNYQKYGPNGDHERNYEGPNDSRQGLNRDRVRNQGEPIDIPYGYDAINDRRRNNGGPPEDVFNKNGQREQNRINPDNIDFRENQNGINPDNRDVRGSQNGINPDNRDVRGSQNGTNPDNRDVRGTQNGIKPDNKDVRRSQNGIKPDNRDEKGIQMSKNPDNQVKIGSQDGSNVDVRGREGKDNISQDKKEGKNLQGQKRKEGTNPDGLNSKDNKPPIEKQKDHLETISKRKPINVTLKLNEEQKTALTEFYGQKDVSALYAEVEDKLRKIFKHHSHMVSVSMGNNIQIEVVRMTKPGWKIICKEREIEAEKLFSQMAQVKTGVEASISFDEMKKLLIIIAVVGKVDPADKNSLWSINKKNDATVAFYKQDLNTTLIKKEPALKQFLTLFSQEPKGSEVKNLQIADDSGESFAEKASVDGDFNDYKLD